MDAADAAKAADFIGCKTIVGVHHNTFGFIKINEAEAGKYLKQPEGTFITGDYETIEINYSSKKATERGRGYLWQELLGGKSKGG